jgi:ferrochelatase
MFAELGQSGVRHLLVICPGFVADCLETIDEIGNVGLEQFRAAGGETLRLVEGLNDRPSWIAAMTEIALEQLQGWRGKVEEVEEVEKVEK